MAIILATLLALVAYLIYQNRGLKTALNTNSNNNSTTNMTMADVIYEQPDNVRVKADNEVNYEDLENYDATYTALDKSSKDDDENHFYSHLNEMPSKETGI